MSKVSYSGYRFPPEIIHQAIWLYLRFTLSFRDVEDLLSERGIAVAYETIRRWVNHFGPSFAADLRKRRPRLHTIWMRSISGLMAACPACDALSIERARSPMCSSRRSGTSTPR